MTVKTPVYPFAAIVGAAIVGQEDMKDALLANIIFQSIVGVLIHGDKGTAKSTTVRALADLLPERDVVKGCIFRFSPSDTRNLCESCRGKIDRNELELMVLDEPTAFLDFPHKIDTMRILKKVAQKTEKSILLSIHDLSLAIRCADQLWIIDQNGAMISGIPEDLVLSGIFGSAFEIDGVSFDPIHGEFTIPVEKKGTFSIVAPESIERIWTLYALERIGFMPAEGSMADIEVMVQKDGEKPVWQLCNSDGKWECENIRELVECISAHYEGGGYH